MFVNNAGFATGGPFAESDPERELDQVRVLVEAPVALRSAFIPGMVGRGAGAVLNVASTAGMQPIPYSAGYSAAKAYVLAFSEALHHELRGAGVTVTALAPGPVSTEFWDVAGWEVGPAARSNLVPPPALGDPEEAARARASAASSTASASYPRSADPRSDALQFLYPPRIQAPRDRVGDAPPLTVGRPAVSAGSRPQQLERPAARCRAPA